MFSLNLERKLATNPALAFDAFTEPDLVIHWFAPGDMMVSDAILDFRRDGRFCVVRQEPTGDLCIVRGQYLEIVENEALRFSWQLGQGDRTSEVAVSFSQVEQDKTLISLAHQGFVEQEHKDIHLQGWTGCLDKLQGFFEMKGRC